MRRGILPQLKHVSSISYLLFSTLCAYVLGWSCEKKGVKNIRTHGNSQQLNSAAMSNKACLRHSLCMLWHQYSDSHLMTNHTNFCSQLSSLPGLRSALHHLPPSQAQAYAYYCSRPSTISGLDSLDWNGGFTHRQRVGWKMRSQTFQGQEACDISYKNSECDGRKVFDQALFYSLQLMMQ